MNLKQKVVITISTIFVTIVMNFAIIINSVKAVDIMENAEINLHYGGLCEQLLKYKGIIVKTTYVEYTYNGQNYPAYCLNKTLPRCN